MGQPNAQNSEVDPKKHPSGARIEKMYKDASVDGEKGLYGETLRPSEREDSVIEGVSEDVHRRSPSTRQT